jgi:hypothetical protein
VPARRPVATTSTQFAAIGQGNTEFMGYEQGALAQMEPEASAPPQIRHAVKQTVAGPAALCGAGPLSIRLFGNFDVAADNVCPDCAALLAVN